MGRRHKKTGGIKLITVRPERRKSTKSLTEFFSVRTDIPPGVVCASFGDHCMEPARVYTGDRVLRNDRKRGKR